MTLHTSELLEKLSYILQESSMEEDKDGKYNDDGIKYTIIDCGEWTDGGKYSYRSDVFFFSELNVYVQVEQSRSGSYYTDYYYNEPEFLFVEPKTETKVITYYSEITVKE